MKNKNMNNIKEKYIGGMDPINSNTEDIIVSTINKGIIEQMNNVNAPIDKKLNLDLFKKLFEGNWLKEKDQKKLDKDEFDMWGYKNSDGITNEGLWEQIKNVPPVSYSKPPTLKEFIETVNNYNSKKKDDQIYRRWTQI